MDKAHKIKNNSKSSKIILSGIFLFLSSVIIAQTTLATFNFESSNLSPSAGAIGSPVLTGSSTVTYNSGSTTSSTASACFASANTKFFELTIASTGYTNITVDWNARTSSTTASWVVTANDGGGYGSTLYTQSLGTSFAAASTLNLGTSFNNNSSIKIKWTANVSATQTVRIDDIVVKGTSAVVPTILVSTTALTGFQYVFGNGPSPQQTFTCSGSSLSSDISLAAPTDYEISTVSGSGFGTTLTLSQSSGSVASTTIYVRLKAGLAIGAYNAENITASSSGAATKTVACSGNVTADGVFINEILVDPSDSNDGTNAPNTSEWVELYNSTSAPVDISCWFITDGDFAVTIPSVTTLAAGGYFTIASAAGSGLSPNLDWALCGCTSGASSQVGIFTNGGEQLLLYNAAGSLIDAVIWGGGQLPGSMTTAAVGSCSSRSVTFPAAASFENIGTVSNGIPNERDYDGSANWQQTATGTFGSSNGINPLPIELLNFSATLTADKVELSWTTASETGNDYFTIEHSSDLVNFSELGKLSGAGNSTGLRKYSFPDPQPLNGINYYRLKQTDFDGRYSYSQIVSVAMNSSIHESVYPNPATNNLHIDLSGKIKGPVNLEIISLQGITLLKKQGESDEHHFIFDLSDIASGTYILKTTIGTNTKQTLIIKD
jgi:hypothetical protein